MVDHTVTKPRTGAERFFAEQMKDPTYAAGYRRARARIDAIDRILRAVDDRRSAQGMSKAELARRALLPPQQVRRVLTAKGVNPTLDTVLAMSAAVGLELRPTPVECVQLETVTAMSKFVT